MLPNREEARKLIEEAGSLNPGPWEAHSRCVAHCAEEIAKRAGMDSEKAYILGLLHDIGRRFGVTYLRHVYDGYNYLMGLGYDEAARVCLTHSFERNDCIEDYVGKFDMTEEELKDLKQKLAEREMDEYDKLIHLCDACGAATGVMLLEERMGDVKRRYGSYPERKWNYNFELKEYFEQKMGMDLYEAVDKEHYRP
ncbi:MAG: HD domain-containing protein [Lachnospiraceae bacterium]|nr:HD domain-containing protein [Lachnospiraceae bacterium]